MNLRIVLWLGLFLAMGCNDDGKTASSDTGPILVEGDEAGECSDEADNDRNGLFDCDDPGCAGSPACDEDDDLDADGGTTEGDDLDADGGTTTGESTGGETTGGGETGAASTGGETGGSGTTTGGGSTDADGSVPSCDDDDDCDDDWTCTTDGFCLPPCTSADDCPEDWVCDTGTLSCSSVEDLDGGAPDGPFEDGDGGDPTGGDPTGGDPTGGEPPLGGSSCSVDADCAADCPTDESCICMAPTSGGEGFCVSACTSDDDCPDGLECDLDSGRCGGGAGGGTVGGGAGGGTVGGAEGGTTGDGELPPDTGLPPIDDGGGSGEEGGGAAGGGEGGGGDPTGGGTAEGEPPLESCTTTDDCSGDKVCLSVGEGTFCMNTCETADDCTEDSEPACVALPDDPSIFVCGPEGGGAGGGEGGEPPDPTVGGTTDGGTAGGEPPDGGEEDTFSATPCDTDSDCSDDDCPADAWDCVCKDFGSGGTCLPGCTVSDHCPDDIPFCDAEGVCGPEVEGEGGTTGGGTTGGGTTGGGTTGGGTTGGDGPSTCDVTVGCAIEECPDDSASCVCADFGAGDAYCVPGCTSDSECPEDFPFCEEGVCSGESDLPSGGDPTACSSDTECSAADCPEDSAGCVCHPLADLCVPACASDSDCVGTLCDTETGTCLPPE